MKQKINGKTYNTETAAKIASAKSKLGKSNPSFWDETLYKTRRGNLFLRGEGGVLTRWSVMVGKGRMGSGRLEALTPEEALAWCEQNHVSADVIAEHFDVDEA